MTRSKADWRRELLAARAAMPEAERRRASLAMLAHVRSLPCFVGARSVVGYLPLGAEADVTPVLVEVAQGGGHVFVPTDGPFEPASCWTAWREGPSSGSRLGNSDLPYPVIVLVPGVGFDEDCVRLGRGQGFYDRALATLRQTGTTHAVGIAFGRQIVPRLPRDTWDESVDVVVSESRVMTPSSIERSARERSACS